MTIETLLGYSLEEMEGMTDAQWEDKLRPFFQVTRPTLTSTTIKQAVIKGNRSNSFEAKRLVDQIAALVKKQQPPSNT